MSTITESLLSNFSEIEDVISVKPYGSGHIHETFLVKTSGKSNYIFQKINHQIFENVQALQQNIEKVLNYLAIQRNNSGTFLSMLRQKNGDSYVVDNDGNYWRAFIFIPGSKTYDKIIKTELAYEGGKAVGSFLHLLKDFPVDTLYETIPKFHDLNFRVKQFEQSVKNDTQKRLSGIVSEIAFVMSRVPKMKRILDLGKQYKIPLRVTHNDTKINNVLFDQNDKAICVIDLDTVMPGYIHYDFGDAIRTGAASADEDETELDKMFIDLKLFEAYSQGFLEQTIGFMNPTEIDELYIAPQILTFTIALRFLTDYLNGDAYFNTAHVKHNLQRWYAQKQLFLSMEENEKEMQQIIKVIENNIKNLK
jgi:Ser/Thr protein kinase RdoA (MazF antagonist)